MGNTTRKELILIRAVNAVCVFFGVTGVIMALVVSSKSMLLDGLYSFVQSIFILISALVVRLLTKGESRNFQFGYAAFEPFFIVIRSVTLLVMTLVLALGAVSSLRAGGYLIRADIAMCYTLFSVVVCAVVWRVLKRYAVGWSSPILEAEARSWFCDTMLSVAVLVGFLLSYLLERAGYIRLASLIDPVVTLIFIIFLSPGLVRQLLSSTRELLGGAPSQDEQKEIRSIIEGYREELSMKDFRVYSTRHGRTLLFSVYIQLEHELPLLYLDRVRLSMIEEINRRWMWADSDIIFTVDPSWFAISAPGAGELLAEVN